MSNHFIKVVIVLFSICLFCSCNMNESEDNSTEKVKPKVSFQTQDENDETSDDDDWSDGWDNDDYNPDWEKNIRQIDLSKSERPFKDACNKWIVVYNDFKKAYLKELKSMIASGNSFEIEKALIYYYWIRTTEIRDDMRKTIEIILNKNIISNEKLQYFYRFSVFNEDPKNFNECIWELRFCDSKIAENFYYYTAPIYYVFQIYENLKNGEKQKLELARNYWLKQRLTKPHYDLLMKANGQVNDGSEKYDNLDDIKSMLEFDNYVIRNEFYYELPECYNFLVDEKYRDSKLETIVTQLFSNLSKLLILPNEYNRSSDDSQLFSSYFTHISRELLNIDPPFFKKDRYKWTKILNDWIEKSVEELEYMLKNCTRNCNGKLTYNGLYFDDIDIDVISLFYLWSSIAPFKFTAHIKKNALNPFWGKRYYKYYSKSHNPNFFDFRTFFIYYRDIYIKSYLLYSKFTPKDAKYKDLIYNITVDNRNMKKYVKDFKKSDWEQFFELDK